MADFVAEMINPVTLRKIIDGAYDGIMVTDKFGKIMLLNPTAAHYLGSNDPNELVGKFVSSLVSDGRYNRSTTQEAIEKRQVVTGLVKVPAFGDVLSSSTPLLDDNGDIIMVITSTRSKELIDNYIAAIEQERNNAKRYKSAAAYLGRLEFPHNTPVAESPQMRQVLFAAGMIAKSDSTVLILGESGTGKEVISRYIHQQSSRAKEPFIPVNCAAIPHELMESEFFGYERGAFSGANARGKQGLFEIADKGTLFLDELAELPLPMQSKLLRVLESGEFQRLGGTQLRSANVRLIAATNRDLRQMVSEKKFREDLYYRLNVIPLILPPLRERPEDIRALAQQFLDGFNRKYNSSKYLSPRALQALVNYTWPGNARELRNVIERAVITSADDELDFGEEIVNSKEQMTAGATPTNRRLGYQGELKAVLREVEKQYINQVLEECGGRISEAARRLGIHRTMLYRKIEKFSDAKMLNDDVD